MTLSSDVEALASRGELRIGGAVTVYPFDNGVYSWTVHGATRGSWSRQDSS